MQDFLGKTVLISGASRGIGRAMALELASRGADIIVNYVRKEDTAQKTKSDIEALGRKAICLQANVGNPDECRTLVQKSLEHFLKIDILIHNAALGAFKPVSQLKLNQWDLSFDVNTKALLVLTQSVLPSMEKSGQGCILALSSLGAHRFIPNYGAIGISKSALENLVRYLAVELAPKKIRVNALSGGLVDTDAAKAFPQQELFKQEVIKRTPAGRLGLPEDLARVAAFLVSADASWITGQTIIADGGLSLI